MLKIKLFRGFAILVVVFGLSAGFFGVRTIHHQIVGEAQTRVLMNIGSAWAEIENRLGDIEIILRGVAGKQILIDLCESKTWDSPELRARFERIRVREGLHFLDVLTPDGRVVMRSTPPFATGDSRVSDPSVGRAMKGDTSTCISLMTQSELKCEADGLVEKAFLEINDTPRARRSLKMEETRGMVMVGAVPIQKGSQILGIVYGGILVNRNHELVDRIHDVVYKDQTYNGRPLGTATIFLGDIRIATTVLQENGNRALGTRGSKEVADSVLDNGKPWVGEAFVVRDWYLTAYDPIRNGVGEIIGMLYVGILRQPYNDAARDVAMRYVFLSLFVLTLALALAFFMADRLSQPIHRLVEATNRMRHGEKQGPVATDSACSETEMLIVAFNQMMSTLDERESKLKALNRSYMETLGFVSHELKSPVATIMNYAYLMREQKLGPLTEKQHKAMKAIDEGSTRLVEMVRHYLNLSRIENHELRPDARRLALLEEVVQPVIDATDATVRERGMRLVNGIGADVALNADANMVREVFENLIGNAIKYGREGGTIELSAKQDGGFVEFSVRNEGEGIPEERLGELFKKFSRLSDSKAARRQRGTGLGLFITKHVVEAHGGWIRAASRPGEWADFVFTLPVYAEAASGK